jgi:hypothetical protein
MKKIILLILMTINSVCFAQNYEWQNSYIASNQEEYIRSSSFINPNTGWVGLEIANTNARVLKTTNKGNSFSEVFKYTDYASNNMSYDIGVCFINESNGFISTGDRIFKTNNGGGSWSTVFTFPNRNASSAIKFADANTGYAAYSADYNFASLYKTTNGGATWNLTCINEYFSSNVSNVCITDISVSPNNSNKVAICGYYYIASSSYPTSFLIKSDNGFQNNSFSNTYYGAGRFSHLSILPNNEVRVFGMKGIYKPDAFGSNLIFDMGTTNDGVRQTGMSFSNQNLGFAVSYDGKIWRTTNSGYNYVNEATTGSTYHQWSSQMNSFNEISYFGINGNIFTRTLGMNLSILYDNVNSSGSFSFDGANKDISSSPTLHYLRGGNSVLSAVSELPGDRYFYSWSFGSMNNYVNNYYFENVGDIKASYKTKLKADNQWAINNANQTKAIRDTTNLNNNPLNLIHQVHESIGGIFYTRSTNGGTNWSREEVVNYSLLSNDALGNTNPSITIKRRDLKPLTFDDQERNVAVVWERYNQSNGKIEVLTADRVLKIIPGTGYEWKRTEYENGNTIFTSFDCSSDPSFKSTPKIFVSSPLTDLRNSIVIVPHLEKVNSTGKVKVILTIRNLYNKFDYVVDNGEDGLISNLAVSSPYNSYDVFDLNIVYQKDNTINNIVYKKVRAGKDSNFGLFALTLETEGNLGNGDGMRARFSPDISVQNGLPVVTYCGNYYDNRIIQYEDETVGDNMLSLTKHTTITRFKTTNNGAWSEYERFTGLNPQENPNVEGSKNAMAYLLSFRKNGSYFQYVRINGLQQPYYCNPGSYPETDAKFVRGSYIGQFGSYFNPSLLTLSDPDNSRFTIDERSFSIDPYSNGTDGYNNLDGIIEKDNTQYSLTLGPIIASNTTYGFEDDTPPQTVQNPVEFNETMVSAVFSLSNYDTLILGAHGKYATSFGQSMQPLKYHVNLVNSTTNQIHRELFRDTINVEDSVGIEFLRGYIINGISSGTDQFYVQMVVDTIDAGDGDYNMAGVYSDDTPPQGDAPINYKTKVFFENSSNSLTSGNQIPKEYSLSQNYPNPFNPSTTIKYSLPKDGFVSLKIYDITGREVKSLAGEVKKAGYYSVTFNASSLASGVYFYRIQSNDFVMTKRMVLIK